VCSAANAQFVRDLGADEVVDYASDDFTRRSDHFDVVFDAACVSSFPAARRILTEAGRYLNTGGDVAAAAGTAISAVFARLTSRQRAVAVSLRNAPAMWRRLAALAEAGVLRPQITWTIALEEVAEAQRAMASGHGRGKVVVRP
jgi:NADPH:quinone reductase-like Zn-dependent oxidoreductase